MCSDHQVCHIDVYRNDTRIERLSLEEGESFDTELTSGDYRLELVEVLEP